MSNTSATDTETQFHMSSDSGSRVQLTDCGTKPTTTAKVAPEHQVEATLRDDVMVLTIVNTQGVRPKARRSLSDFTEAGASSSSSVPSVSQAQHESLMRKASGGSLFGTAEIAQDFVMIDLKTPFAQTCVMSPYEIQMRLNPLLHRDQSGGAGFPTADLSLGSFFKDVSAAPQLSTLPGPGPGAGDPAESWSCQLDTFETRMAEYDDLLNQMGSGSEAEPDS